MWVNKLAIIRVVIGINANNLYYIFVWSAGILAKRAIKGNKQTERGSSYEKEYYINDSSSNRYDQLRLSSIVVMLTLFSKSESIS